MKRWRMHVALLAAFLVDLDVSQAAAQEELEPFLACAAEADAAARLACFDAAIARLRRDPAPAAAAPAPAVAPVPAAAVAPAPAPVAAVPSAAAAVTPAATASSPAGEPTPEEKFGLRGDLRKELTGELSELTASATSIAAKPRGELVITLDNGQVWTEIAPGSTIRLKPGDPVKIEAGSLGSYWLTAPNGRSSRVSRVR